MKKFILCSLALMALPFVTATAAETPRVKVVDDYLLNMRGLKSPLDVEKLIMVEDSKGSHALVLSRTTQLSPSQPHRNRKEYLQLTAEYYRAVKSGWELEWMVKDFSDCPNMDLAGDFFYNEVSVTDLNNDGEAEVTLPYHMFCGTSVDPHTLKVVMREGSAKYAVRGTSLIKYPHQPTYGGDRTFDKSLDAADKSKYKQHLTKVWLSVVGAVQGTNDDVN